MPSPTHALAHTFLPNLVKLKTAATVVGVIERKEKFFFDTVWQQAHVDHAPSLFFHQRGPYRCGVISLPPPKDLGDAYMVAVVVHKQDVTFSRYYTLEKDYVLKTKSDRTLVCERDGATHRKHFDGPSLTGTFDTDALAFVDAFMEIHVPTKVNAKKDTTW